MNYEQPYQRFKMILADGRDITVGITKSKDQIRKEVLGMEVAKSKVVEIKFI